MFVLPVVAHLLFLIIYLDKRKSVVEAVVTAWLFMTLYTWVIMELFGAFGLLNTVMVLFAWSGLCLLLGFIVAREHLVHKIRMYWKNDWQTREFWREHRTGVICLCIFCGAICLLSCLRGQNLVDNVYHRLPKIMHWIQNGRVGYFVTPTPGEIKYSALVEYMTAQIYLLKGPDRLINLVQAGAYASSGCCIYGISRKLGASQKFAMLSSWIFFLTPMVIIETLTTQTDVAAGFYLLAFIYMILDYIHADQLKMDRRGALSAVCLSATVMFGYLAKPTVCFAMVIFFMWMCVVRLIKKDKAVVLAQYVLIGAVTAAVLFLPGAVRDYQYRNTPGITYDANAEESVEESDNAESTDDGQAAGGEAEEQQVDTVTIGGRVAANLSRPRELLAACVRNLAANATSRSLPKMNKMLERMVEKFESALDYYGGARPFRVMVESGLGETSEPSPAIMYFLLFFWICVITRMSRISKEQFIYMLLAGIALGVQAGAMGYTWYNQRYLIGIMAVSCPAFAVALEQLSVGIKVRLHLATAMITICSLGAVNALTYEVPYTVFGLQGAKIHQYFIHDSASELYYQMMLDYINENGYKTVGMQGVVSYEYVLWQGIRDHERIEHVNVDPTYFESAKLEDTEFIPQCIVEEMPEVYGVSETMQCNGKTYTCGWRADGENGREYAVWVLDE